jgi:hypothetical protein
MAEKSDVFCDRPLAPRALVWAASSPVIGLLLTGIQPAAAGTRRKAERWKKGRGGETF